MKYLITKVLSSKERKKYERKNLYCYDFRDSDFGSNIASIEKKSKKNRIGSIITNEEIFIDNKYPYGFVDYESFTSQNESVDKIQYLLFK